MSSVSSSVSSTALLFSQALQPNAVWLMATGNANKVSELTEGLRSLGVAITLNKAEPKALEGLEENAETFAANATLKVRWLAEAARQKGLEWILADDSGLIVPTLKGTFGLNPFPGLHSNRWLTTQRYEALFQQAAPDSITGEHKCQGLLKLLEGSAKRAGAFVCALALLHVPTGQVVTVEGHCPVEVITTAPRGSNGFGYDPICLPAERETLSEETPKTMAELPQEEKQRLSHRAKALQALVQSLQQA